MPTENNDYANWLAQHTADTDNHNKNGTLKKKVYTLKEREYNLPMEYENYPKKYEKPLLKVLNCDPKWRQMNWKELEEQARIQLEKQQYTTQQTRFGPYKYADAA